MLSKYTVIAIPDLEICLASDCYRAFNAFESNKTNDEFNLINVITNRINIKCHASYLEMRVGFYQW